MSDTVPIRVNDAMYAELRSLAKLRGVSMGQVACDAWEWWWRRNGDRVVDECIVALEAMRPTSE